MSFLTEYFDEYRQHPIRKTQMCRPENRYAIIDGNWLDPKVGSGDKAVTEEEIEQFIKETMMSLRGQSTYYNDFCSHLSPEFKTRPFKPREKKRRPCKSEEKTEEVEHIELPKPLALKDTEVMKMAKALYEKDLNKPTLKPLPTHFRILGYARPSLFTTGHSDYSENIARLAYETVRDDRIPKYVASNGCRPRWPLPPDGRQPPIDGAPFDGERLF